jgi:hypothetical protein
MADDKQKNAEDNLDALFAEARRVGPDADLVARVLADAEAVQREIARTAQRPTRSGVLRRPPAWIAALGGWGGFGGVTAAGLVGLAVGFWSPEMIDVLSGGQLWTLSGGGLSPDLTALALENSDV